MLTRAYWAASRAPRYSLTFALPLLVLYEGLSAALSATDVSTVRNGADVLLKTVFIIFGGRLGLTIFSALLIGVGGWLVWRDRRRHPGPLAPRVFGGMLVESLVYAAFLGTLVSVLTNLLLQAPVNLSQDGVVTLTLPTQLVVSLGAGIYEELVFRVLLVSAFVAVGRLLGWRRPVVVGAAVVASAIVFSGFHYIGSLGDTFTVPSFTFRAIAGVVLSGLYVSRGFGIAAWTHALYDVALALAA
jgi:membrane protease YdiL (CAAX protease family)